jgi:hypothetical protein
MNTKTHAPDDDLKLKIDVEGITKAAAEFRPIWEQALERARIQRSQVLSEWRKHQEEWAMRALSPHLLSHVDDAEYHEVIRRDLEMRGFELHKYCPHKIWQSVEEKPLSRGGGVLQKRDTQFWIVEELMLDGIVVARLVTANGLLAIQR